MNKFESFKSEGAIYAHQKTSEKQPDWRGFIRVTPDQIKNLIRQGKSGAECQLRVALWDRVVKDSSPPKHYFYCASEVVVKKEESAPAPADPKPTASDFDDIPF